MARPRILDSRIISKIAKKLNRKDTASINVLVSKKAFRLGISAEAALILLAKEHGIGTSTFQRKLDPTKQAEVRDALPTVLVGNKSLIGNANKTRRASVKQTVTKKSALRMMTEFLIEDQELLSRCQDILLASSNFDRPVNQATLVLEDRIRRKSKPLQKMVGDSLVGYAFNEELSKTVLRVASNESDDQRGFTQVLRGIVPSFRNKTHHHIVNTFSRQEAMRVCCFIDVLLRVVDNSVKVK